MFFIKTLWISTDVEEIPPETPKKEKTTEKVKLEIKTEKEKPAPKEKPLEIERKIDPKKEEEIRTSVANSRSRLENALAEKRLQELEEALASFDTLLEENNLKDEHQDLLKTAQKELEKLQVVESTRTSLSQYLFYIK